MNKFRIEIVNYATNNNLALLLYEEDELYCDLTINLGVKLLDNLAYLDVNNVPSDVLKMLEDKGIYEITGNYRQSGFVSYPLARFNMEKIEEFNKGE